MGGATSNTVASTYFYEINDNGLYYLNYSQNAQATIAVPSLGLTLNYLAQNINFTGTTKYPLLFLPATLGDSTTTTNIVATSSYTATSAAFGLSNTPAQTKITSTTTNVVVARGTANLKNIVQIRVLVCKDTYNDKTNYFLGGAPAPAIMLATLGLTDGAITTGVVYRVYAEGTGLVGVIEVSPATNKVVAARFRKA